MNLRATVLQQEACVRTAHSDEEVAHNRRAAAAARELESTASAAGRWSVVQRVAAVGSKLVTVPLVIGVLGRPRYGAWLTIASAMAFLTWSDLGVPSAVTSPLSVLVQKGDFNGARRVLQNALKLLCAVSFVAGILLAVILSACDLSRVFGPSIRPFYREFCTAVAVVGALTLINLPLRLIESLAMALGRIKWLAIADTGTALTSLALVFYWHDSNPSLGALSLLMLLPNTVGRVFVWVYLTRTIAVLARESLEGPRELEGVALIRRGAFFTAAAIAEVAFTQVATIAISRTQGVEFVPAFAIPFQLFSTAMQGIVALLWPMWGAYAQGACNGQWEWIRRAHGRVLARTLVLSISGFGLLALLAPTIIARWVGPQYVPQTAALLMFWALFCVWAWCHGWNILVVGLDLVRPRTLALIALAVVAVVVTPLTVRAWGVLGGPAGLLVALVGTQAWMLPAICARRHDRLSGNRGYSATSEA